MQPSVNRSGNWYAFIALKKRKLRSYVFLRLQLLDFCLHFIAHDLLGDCFGCIFIFYARGRGRGSPGRQGGGGSRF